MPRLRTTDLQKELDRVAFHIKKSEWYCNALIDLVNQELDRMRKRSNELNKKSREQRDLRTAVKVANRLYDDQQKQGNLL